MGPWAGCTWAYNDREVGYGGLISQLGCDADLGQRQVELRPRREPLSLPGRDLVSVSPEGQKNLGQEGPGPNPLLARPALRGNCFPRFADQSEPISVPVPASAS